MNKEFTISVMDPDVTTVRGKTTGIIYKHKLDNWWEWDNEDGGKPSITWPNLLLKEGTVVEVPFGTVGSVVTAEELYRLPVTTIVRGCQNGLPYIKSTGGLMVWLSGGEYVPKRIDHLGGTFEVEWVDKPAPGV